MTGAEYLAFLRARMAPIRPAARARNLITKFRTGRYKHNAEIMELCDELEARLHVRPDPVPKPDWSLHAVDKKQYYRRYMRWYRQNGQTREGRA